MQEAGFFYDRTNLTSVIHFRTKFTRSLTFWEYQGIFLKDFNDRRNRVTPLQD